MTEQEYTENIEKALDEKKYSEVVVLSNDLISQLYSELAEREHVSEDAKYEIESPIVLKFFSEHGMSQILWMKGIAALHLADIDLAGRSFKDAIGALPVNTMFINPYLGLAFVLTVEGNDKTAATVVTECKEKYPSSYKVVAKEFNDFYDQFLSIEFVKLEVREKLKKLFI